MTPPPICFDHERLIAYQRSIRFVVWANRLLERVPARLSVRDQLDRASTSIPLNIAEGNSKYTAPDRCRYFDTARGSALECAACLDVLVAKGHVTPDEAREGKAVLHDTVCLLLGLVRSIAPQRLGEEPRLYRTWGGEEDGEGGHEREHEQEQGQEQGQEHEHQHEHEQGRG